MPMAEDVAAQDFASIVASHRPQVFRFLLASTRDVALAETLTQECFLKAHRNWAGFRGESSALTWLMRIAINVQKDHWRNRRLQFWRTTRTNSVDVDEAGEWLPSTESSPELQLLAEATNAFNRTNFVPAAVQRGNPQFSAITVADPATNSKVGQNGNLYAGTLSPQFLRPREITLSLRLQF